MEFNKTKFKDDHRDLFVIDKIGGAKMFERRDLNLNNVETDIDKWDLFNEDPDHIWKEDNRKKKGWLRIAHAQRSKGNKHYQQRHDGLQVAQDIMP